MVGSLGLPLTMTRLYPPPNSARLLSAWVALRGCRADIEVSDPGGPSGESPPQGSSSAPETLPCLMISCPPPRTWSPASPAWKVFSAMILQQAGPFGGPRQPAGPAYATLQAWALLLTICPSTHIGPILDR